MKNPNSNQNCAIVALRLGLPMAFGASALKPLLATATLALLVATSPGQAAGRNPNPGVLPINSHPYGKSYGDWGAEWWKWVYSFPVAQNPIQDPTGAFGALNQSGPVWFLAGTFGEVAERSVTIPAGKAIFFALFNIFNDYPCPDPNFQPAPGQTLEEFLAEGAAAFIDPATHLAADVDGAPIQNLFDYRARSSLVTFTADPSWVALDPCVTGEPQQGVSDGYWIMLAPLRPGQHTIHFASEAVFGDFVFSLDVTFHITVE